MSEAATLSLDPAIRDWVVLPMVFIIAVTGFLRNITSQLLRSSKPLPPSARAHRGVCQRTSRLRAAGGFLNETRWNSRRSYWTGGALTSEETGILSKEKKEEAAAPNPAAAMEGMMGNASFMIQNMVMMQGIQHFFSGYILVKVPLPLTRGFKTMFQRGIDLRDLDTSYVSSVSWYFLVMFGLRGFFRLVIGDMSPDEKASIALQSEFGNTLQQQKPLNAKQAFKSENDNLEISKYNSIIDGSEKMLLGNRYPKMASRSKTKGKGKNRGDDIFGEAAGGGSKSKKDKSQVPKLMQEGIRQRKK